MCLYLPMKQTVWLVVTLDLLFSSGDSFAYDVCICPTFYWDYRESLGYGRPLVTNRAIDGGYLSRHFTWWLPLQPRYFCLSLFGNLTAFLAKMAVWLSHCACVVAIIARNTIWFLRGGRAASHLVTWQHPCQSQAKVSYIQIRLRDLRFTLIWRVIGDCLYLLIPPYFNENK